MNYNCNNHCYSITTFDITSKRFRSSKSPILKIEFKFSFISDYLSINQIQDYSTTQLFRQDLPSSTDDTSATVDVEESLSFQDTVDAVVEAVGDRLGHEDLVKLVDFVWLEVKSSFPTKTLPKFNILHLGFEIRTVHVHGSAVDSSFALLEKCEVVRVNDDEEERCCCICLEKLRRGDGGGALRMPCSHVFHGGCIGKWLTTSHSCPLCRYEMPSQ